MTKLFLNQYIIFLFAKRNENINKSYSNSFNKKIKKDNKYKILVQSHPSHHISTTWEPFRPHSAEKTTRSPGPDHHRTVLRVDVYKANNRIHRNRPQPSRNFHTPNRFSGAKHLFSSTPPSLGKPLEKLAIQSIA